MQNVGSTEMSRPLWKQRNFMLLWGGQLVSWLGTEVSSIALPLVVLALTGSTAQAGSVAAIRGLVYVIWALPTGALLDRWNRKTVMLVANLGSGLAMGSIATGLATHHLTITILYIACAVEGSCFVFANLARFASFRKIVPEEQLAAATAQSESATHLALFVGPPLGGFLFQAAGGFAAFFADALSYLMNACSVFLITTPLGVETKTARKAMYHEVKEAILWLKGEPTKRFLTLIQASRTAVLAGLYLLIVVRAREQHASSVAIGLIFAVAAIGGILGATLAAKVYARYRLKQLLIAIGLLSFLVMNLYFVASSSALLAAVTALFYAIDPLWEVSTGAHPVAMVPDYIRGRVLSLTRMVLLAANALGLFVTGQVLHYWGSGWTIGLYVVVLFVLLTAVLTNKRIGDF